MSFSEAPAILFWKDSDGVISMLPPTRPNRLSRLACTDSMGQRQSPSVRFSSSYLCGSRHRVIQPRMDNIFFRRASNALLERLTRRDINTAAYSAKTTFQTFLYRFCKNSSKGREAPLCLNNSPKRGVDYSIGI